MDFATKLDRPRLAILVITAFRPLMLWLLQFIVRQWALFALVDIANAAIDAKQNINKLNGLIKSMRVHSE